MIEDENKYLIEEGSVIKKQPPVLDCVSRQAVLNIINKPIIIRAKKQIKALPSVQPEQRWIPVSEKLPDEYGEYLVTKHIIERNHKEYISNDIAYFDNDGFHKADTITAWMPLPEPYKADRRMSNE